MRKIGAATTDAQKEEYRNKGACFKCGQQGHMARDCPSGSRGTASGSRPPPYIREMATEDVTPTAEMSKDPIQLAKTIRAMLKDLPEEERNLAMDDLEVSGFD